MLDGAVSGDQGEAPDQGLTVDHEGREPQGAREGEPGIAQERKGQLEAVRDLGLGARRLRAEPEQRGAQPVDGLVLGAKRERLRRAAARPRARSQPCGLGTSGWPARGKQ